MTGPAVPSLRRIFIGSNGLRAGWGVLIFVSAAFGVGFYVMLRIHGRIVMPKSSISFITWLAVTSCGCYALWIATRIMAAIERRPPLSYGILDGQFVGKFAAGFAACGIYLAFLVGILSHLGYIAIGGLSLSAIQIPFYGIGWFSAFALGGLQDELLFRGYIQSTLIRGTGFWQATVLSSLIEAVWLLSIDYPHHPGLPEMFLGGVMFCVIRRITGSIWANVGIHTAWSWIPTFVCGIPAGEIYGQLLNIRPTGDAGMSGGSSGPIASALAEPLCAIYLLVAYGLLRLSGWFEGIAPDAPTESTNSE